jgi:hypothetical protein
MVDIHFGREGDKLKFGALIFMCGFSCLPKGRDLRYKI